MSTTSATSASSVQARPPGSHGVQPLSRRTRRRLLGELLRRAEEGDIGACEALVRLNMQNEARALDPPQR